MLFRAKKAVIVGDDKQLPHLSFLEKAKEQSFLSQYNIPDKYQLMWRFRTNSMFDLANYFSNLKKALTSPLPSDMIHTKGTLWYIVLETRICRKARKRAIISANTLIGMECNEAADA